MLLDQLPRAVAELREAAQQEPKEPQAHEDLADVLAATGDSHEATTSAYERVLSLNQTSRRRISDWEWRSSVSTARQRRGRISKAAASSSNPEIAQTARRA